MLSRVREDKVKIAKDFLSLHEISFSELSSNNIGVWPDGIKFVLIISVVSLSFFVGYYSYIERLKVDVNSSIIREENLRKEYEKKSSQASSIHLYRLQMAKMEEMFLNLVGQLPSANEVPALLEDVTQRGVVNGLSITSIDLQEEQPREFYIEMPIKIKAEGGYHDLGAFVSGLAALPRIVTLHDFSVSSLDIESAQLGMTMEVKTYRYKSEELVK